MIVSKWKTIKQARSQADRFEDQFWSGSNLASLYESVKQKGDPAGMEHIFASGFREYVRLHRTQKVSAIAITDTALRSMKVAMSREVEELEHYLSFLATVGSTAPYVGLFGTVWGIMNAFRALSDVQQATLAAVAPGIAEALIATAMGAVRRDPRGDCLQPLLQRRGAPGASLRQLRRGVHGLAAAPGDYQGHGEILKRTERSWPPTDPDDASTWRRSMWSRMWT